MIVSVHSCVYTCRCVYVYVYMCVHACVGAYVRVGVLSPRTAYIRVTTSRSKYTLRQSSTRTDSFWANKSTYIDLCTPKYRKALILTESIKDYGVAVRITGSIRVFKRVSE